MPPLAKLNIQTGGLMINGYINISTQGLEIVDSGGYSSSNDMVINSQLILSGGLTANNNSTGISNPSAIVYSGM